MKNRVSTTILFLVATSMIAAVPADAAKRKKSKPQATYYSQTASDSHAGNYYYRGTGAFNLRDRASAHFGSPVRGREFFEDIASRGGE